MAKVTELVLTPMKYKTAVVTIEGVTPLMSNKFSEKSMDEIEAKQLGKVVKIGAKGKAPRDPQEEFESSIHMTHDGKPGFPSIAIKESLVITAGRLTGAVMTHLRASFNIPIEILGIAGDYPVMDRRIGYIKSGMGKKTAMPVYRAKYENWSIDVPIRYLENVSIELITNFLNMAGEATGIGSFRPENKGPFGQFKVTEVKE